MTTKAQERKALEQIKKIVAELGEDSYVAMAFEGCFDDAEENIENDFALSMNGRWQDAEQKIEKCKAEKKELEAENKRLAEMLENARAEVERLVEKADALKAQKKELEQWYMEERKDVSVGTTDGQHETKGFAEIRFFNNNGFRFINIVEKSGWTNSYKIEDLTELTIK